MQDTLAAPSINAPAPDFDLRATNGQSYSLRGFADSNAVAIVFLANHCPYVGSWEDRLLAIAAEYAQKGVAFVAISSSDVSKFPQDGPDEMARRGYPFPYLFDETQSVARAYGATRTPEVFVVDRDGILRYHGAIDSDWEEGEGTEPYLRDALDGILRGEAVTKPETKPVGCTIKLTN